MAGAADLLGPTGRRGDGVNGAMTDEDDSLEREEPIFFVGGPGGGGGVFGQAGALQRVLLAVGETVLLVSTNMLPSSLHPY